MLSRARTSHLARSLRQFFPLEAVKCVRNFAPIFLLTFNSPPDFVLLKSVDNFQVFQNLSYFASFGTSYHGLYSHRPLVSTNKSARNLSVYGINRDVRNTEVSIFTK